MSETIDTSAQDLQEVLYDNDVRIDAMWPFPCWNAGSELADMLQTYITDKDDFPEEWAPILKYVDEYEMELLLDSDGPDFMDAFNELSAAAMRNNIFGFIASVATPFVDYSSATRGSYSWGHTHQALLFAYDIHDLAKRIEKWADQMEEKDKKRAGFSDAPTEEKTND